MSGFVVTVIVVLFAAYMIKQRSESQKTNKKIDGLTKKLASLRLFPDTAPD